MATSAKYKIVDHEDDRENSNDWKFILYLVKDSEGNCEESTPKAPARHSIRKSKPGMQSCMIWYRQKPTAARTSAFDSIWMFCYHDITVIPKWSELSIKYDEMLPTDVHGPTFVPYFGTTWHWNHRSVLWSAMLKLDPCGWSGGRLHWTVSLPASMDTTVSLSPPWRCDAAGSFLLPGFRRLKRLTAPVLCTLALIEPTWIAGVPPMRIVRACSIDFNRLVGR